MATIEWINHASYVLSDGKVTLITDPWLEGSAFNNAWEEYKNAEDRKGGASRRERRSVRHHSRADWAVRRWQSRPTPGPRPHVAPRHRAHRRGHLLQGSGLRGQGRPDGRVVEIGSAVSRVRVGDL